MRNSDGGKGSAPRPFSVSNEEYANRWDAIFGKDKQNSNVDPYCPHEACMERDGVLVCSRCGYGSDGKRQR